VAPAAAGVLPLQAIKLNVDQGFFFLISIKEFKLLNLRMKILAKHTGPPDGRRDVGGHKFVFAEFLTRPQVRFCSGVAQGSWLR
jgi:hypothetical protein